MKLKSYFNPTRDSKLVQTVQVRLAADLAPTAPYVELGALTHEPVDDNLSGAQLHSISHAIYQHVQEQVYLKHGVQDMQKIRIITGGAFVLPERMLASVSAQLVALATPITVKFSVDPVAATIDGYSLKAENPDLVTITPGAAGEYSVTFKQEGMTVLTGGIANTPFFQHIPIQTQGYNNATLAMEP